MSHFLPGPPIPAKGCFKTVIIVFSRYQNKYWRAWIIWFQFLTAADQCVASLPAIPLRPFSLLSSVTSDISTIYEFTICEIVGSAYNLCPWNLSTAMNLTWQASQAAPSTSWQDSTDGPSLNGGPSHNVHITPHVKGAWPVVYWTLDALSDIICKCCPL